MNLVNAPSNASAVLVPIKDLAGVTGGNKSHKAAGPRAAHQDGKADELPPIHLIRYSDGRYSILDGCHRLEAARDAGEESVRAIIHYHPAPFSQQACRDAHAPHLAAHTAATVEVAAEVERLQASGAGIAVMHPICEALRRGDPVEALRLLRQHRP